MIGNPSSSSSSSWSRLEDKLFERALVVFPDETADRWEKIATQVPGKTWLDVKQHYEDLVYDVQEIHSGRVELPSYQEESATNQVCFGTKPREKETGERRKGVPWTEEEHRLFLIGLQRYGKGDWRSISRNAVVSRTPTQVASHAQKYFLRLNSVKKEKKRPSIHDITPNAGASPTDDPNWSDFVGPNNYNDPGSPSSTFHGFGFPM